MTTCPKCHRPVNEGNSPNAAECHGPDDDEGVCEAYALVHELRDALRSVGNDYYLSPGDWPEHIRALAYPD